MARGGRGGVGGPRAARRRGEINVLKDVAGGRAGPRVSMDAGDVGWAGREARVLNL